jgi:hypothetical protein
MNLHRYTAGSEPSKIYLTSLTFLTLATTIAAANVRLIILYAVW